MAWENGTHPTTPSTDISSFHSQPSLSSLDKTLPSPSNCTVLYCTLSYPSIDTMHGISCSRVEGSISLDRVPRVVARVTMDGWLAGWNETR